MANLKYEIGDQLLFTAYSEWGEYSAEGIVEGFGDYAKRLWGEEVGALQDDEAYVIRTVDRFGNTHRHLVYPHLIEAKKIK